MTLGKRIEDYGLIGDGQTAALVGRDGTIEWLCFPRFDSEACFAALIGTPDNGYWRLSPDGQVIRSCRSYQGDTLILETVWQTDSGEAAVIDFMPMRGQAPDVIRIVEGRAGRVAMRSVLAPRFDYGRISPLIERRGPGELLAIAGPDALAVRADTDIAHDGGTLTSLFEVVEGQRVAFSLTWYPSHEDRPGPLDPPRDLEQTRDFWEGWAAQLQYDGTHRPVVMRSLLTLKALVNAPTGAIVAAPTTSLPEQPGGTRNWDYRYCWLRDATWTLLTFHHAGFRAEARAWIGWLRRTLAGEPVNVRPFYPIAGSRTAHEHEADWLAGFDNSRPVRIGNAAQAQRQLDVYGEVLDTLLVACRNGVETDNDALFRLLVRKVEELWQHPDAGLWESRGPAKHHVHSKVMCWVAFDRAASWFDHDPGLRRHYADLAAQVHAEILDRGFDQGRNCFTAAYGDPALDAALLAIPLVGFLPADDPRVVGTVAAIERELVVGGYVRRYAPQATDDGVNEDEGAFLACGFWLADVYALQGRREDAQALFDRLCATANDLGLLAEEVSIEEGRFLGNFPQALSHLSLVGTALSLASSGGPVHERQQHHPARR